MGKKKKIDKYNKRKTTNRVQSKQWKRNYKNGTSTISGIKWERTNRFIRKGKKRDILNKINKRSCFRDAMNKNPLTLYLSNWRRRKVISLHNTRRDTTQWNSTKTRGELWGVHEYEICRKTGNG